MSGPWEQFQGQQPSGPWSQFQQPGNATQAQPAPSPEQLANAAGQKAGRDQGSLVAAIGQAAQQETFGLQNYVNAGTRYAAQHLVGVNNPDSFNTDLAYSRGMSEGEAEGHPIAATVGGTTGTVMGGGLGKMALGAMRGVPLVGDALAALFSPAEGKVANVARSLARNGAIGGTIATAQGQDLPQAAQTAGLSSVGGTALEHGGGALLSRLAPYAEKALSAVAGATSTSPAAQRAWAVLSRTLKESSATLAAARDSFQTLTGRQPSMAELTGLKSQGALRSLANANSTIGEAAARAADMGGAPLHEQLAAVNAGSATKPQTALGLRQARDDAMGDAMRTPDPQTGIALADTPVKDPSGILNDPHIAYALLPNTTINARLGQVSPVLERIQNGQATIGDADTARKVLRDMQASLLRPAPGGLHTKDPILAKEFGDLATKVEQLTAKSDNRYAAALNDYRAQSDYAEGFTHGMTGGRFDDAGDPLTAKALSTPIGEAGYQHGNVLYGAKRALDAISPGRVTPQPTVNTGNVAQAAMAASSGGPGMIYHAMRAIPGLHLPDSVQQVIAKQLFDPSQTQQGIANLARARVSSAQIRQLATTIGGAAGANIARYLGQPQ